MRDERDVIRVTLQLEATIEVDLQRAIEEDPNWRAAAAGQEPAELYAALENYLQHYVVRERFLRDMPSTCGPGDVRIISLDTQDEENLQHARESYSDSGAGGDGGGTGAGVPA